MLNLTYFVLLEGGIMTSIINSAPLLLIIVVFYMFFIRPQAKRQKEQGKFLGAVAKGEEIVTTSGIIGKINKIEDNIVTIQVDTKTFLRITKSSISKEMTDNLNKETKS